MLYSILFVSAALEIRKLGGRFTSISLVLLLFCTVIYFTSTAKQYQQFTNWQAETRKLANRAVEGVGSIYVYGSYKTLYGAIDAGIQAHRGLRLRLAYLTGRDVYVCAETPDACKGHPQEKLSDQNLSTIKVRQLSDRPEIRIPAHTH
jgi:hypothetical protein